MKMRHLAFLLATVTGWAGEWNQFRGPGGAACAEAGKVPAAPAPADIAWKLKLPGKGHGSPVSWGGRIFVTSEDATRPGVRYVMGIDAAGGRELWRHEDRFEPYEQHQFNSYAASTPAVDPERVYVSWISGDQREVLALTHEGQEVWKKRIGYYSEKHGTSASPIVHEGRVIVPNDHSEGRDAGIFALDAATGEVLWKAETSTQRTAFSTPLVVTGPDGAAQIVVSSQPMALMALDPATGRRLWEVRRPVDDARAVSSPVWADGLIFASVGQGGNGRGAVAVKPGSSDGSVKPEVVWEAGNRLPYVPTPVAVGPRLFILNDGGIISCVRASDGERLWEERGPGKAYSSPVCISGRLYLISRDGRLMTVGAGEKFEVLGELELGEECQTTPAVAGGRLIIRTDSQLLALGGASGDPRP